MFLYYLIFFVIICCSFYDLRKTIICWIPVQFLFNGAVCLRYSPPAITFNLAVTFVLFINFLKNRRKEKRLENFILSGPFYAYLFSYTVSTFVSIVPLGLEITSSLKFFLEGFGLIYLFYWAIRTKADLNLFVYCLLGVFLIITILGLYEVFFHDNPWQDFIFENCPSISDLDGKTYYSPIMFADENMMRYGMVRAFSVFSIYISYGIVSVAFLFLFISLYNFTTELNKKILLIGAICCFVGIFICNSKTGMIGLIFFLLASFRYNQIFNLKTLFLMIIIVFIVNMYLPDYLNNLYALFDNNIAEEGGGSNLSMRERQYEVGLRLFFDNPIFGSGPRSLDILSAKVANADILGSESIWLKILPQRGVIGAIAYVYFYKKVYDIFKISLTRKISFLFVVGCIAMETATPRSEFLPLLGFLTVFFYKCKQIAYLCLKND